MSISAFEQTIRQTNNIKEQMNVIPFELYRMCLFYTLSTAFLLSLPSEKIIPYHIDHVSISFKAILLSLLI